FVFCVRLCPRFCVLFPCTTLFRSERPDPYLERRDAERLADLFVRIPQLLDNLGINALHGERNELHVRTNHRNLAGVLPREPVIPDRKSTRLNSSHVKISYSAFCLK